MEENSALLEHEDELNVLVLQKKRSRVVQSGTRTIGGILSLMLWARSQMKRNELRPRLLMLLSCSYSDSVPRWQSVRRKRMNTKKTYNMEAFHWKDRLKLNIIGESSSSCGSCCHWNKWNQLSSIDPCSSSKFVVLIGNNFPWGPASVVR